MSNTTDFRKVVAQQQAEARATFKQLARIYPGAFTKDGKPLVAVLRLPRIKP